MKYLYPIVLLFVVIISCSKDDVQLENDSLDQITNDTIVNDTTTITEIDIVSDAEFASKNFGTTKTSNFIGKLTDIDAQPLEGVKITIGNQTVLTDVNGVFVLNEVTVNEKFAFIEAEKESYILGSRSIVPTASGSNLIAITLLKKNSIKSVNSGETSEVSLPNGAKVNFGGGFVDASGASYSGKVAVSMHYLEPNESATFSQMPGSLFGKRENNEASAMETYGMLAINLYSPAGEVLNISEETPAQLHFPVSTTTPNAPSSIPLWYFDEAVGYWKEQGTATIVDGEYVAEVSHFTWWNCDLPIDVINVCFELKNNATLSNTYFEIRRYTNNQLVYSGYTDEQGGNCGLFPKNEALTISILSDCGSEVKKITQEIGPYAEDNLSISININELLDLATTTFTANVTNCNNEPLLNGYAFIYTKNGVTVPKILSITNGKIEQLFVFCKDGDYGVIVVDSDNNEVSDEIDIVINGDDVTNLDKLQTCPGTGGGIFEGSITLKTQEEVETFGSFGYAEVTGDIVVDGQQTIISFASLSNLKTVRGTFYIRSGVQNLMGLENLETVGSNLDFVFNDELTSLAALKNLTSVGEHFALGVNKNLASLDGLHKLTSVGSIEINGNQSLTSIAGLENLTAVKEHLGIYSNTNLTTLQGLHNMTSVGLSLTIQDNSNLSTLSGLENITSVGGNLKIRGQSNLVALTGLEKLNSVDYVIIGDDSRPNPILEDFCALTSLFATGSYGNVLISNNKYNPSVNDISSGACKEEAQSGGKYEGSITLTTQEEVDDFALLGYNEVTGDVTIDDNGSNSITSLANFEYLTKIGGTFIITNTQLTSLQGLDNLTFIGDRLTISTNNSLTALTGLDKLTAIEGNYITITSNSSLSSLTGLEKMTSIKGQLYISYNHSLTSLAGLDNITSIERALVIHQNHGLISLSGLNQLTSVGNSLYLSGSSYSTDGLTITTNIKLTSLTGLENLTSIRGDLTLSNNKELPTLEGLENVTVVNGHLIVRKNTKLTSLQGLDNLNSILYNLTITSSGALTSIAGLKNLTSIGTALSIHETGLTTLNGLEKLNSVGETITIGTAYDENFNVIYWPNYSLTDFCALTNLITNGTYNEVLIEGNAYNPTVSDLRGTRCKE